MRLRFLLKAGAIATIFAFLLMRTATAQVQTDTLPPTSLDPKLLEWQNAKLPREYTVAEIKVNGIKHLDTAVVLSISGLQVGDKFRHPGSDIFSKAITNLWKQRLFSDVDIYITKIVDDKVSIELNVMERPRLGSIKWHGIKKSDADELQGKIALVKQTLITEHMRRNINEVTTKFYQEKGFQNIKVRVEEKPEANYVNTNALNIYVTKGKKVKIDGVSFIGNESVDEMKLKKQMKGTKEKLRISLYPTNHTNPYGQHEEVTFKEYLKDYGFLSFTKTRRILDPYLRIRFGNGKYNPTKYEEDKEKVLKYYNSLGFRDAQIVADTVSSNGNNLYVDLKVSEGSKYYFGNIVWKGNAKYGDSLLNRILDIRKGDIYNLDILNKRLGKEQSTDGGMDIQGLYMDDGYLFYQADAIETAVYNDTIDHEIRLREGPQARIKNVTIAGNDRTKDHVIRRELRTMPGELFSRSDMIRSIRELANLNYFNQESINPVPVPNADDGTVDINWKLEEKSSDQLELSAGWGGGIGLTGTLGVTFNNFSIRNIWKRESWDPLPTGDGQKLSLRIQSNGAAFRSYNFSFTEPWLGGKKRNSLTLAYNNSKYTNSFDPFTGRIDRKRSDTTYLIVNGISAAFGKQLKWPDDFFNLVFTASFQQYKMRNYPIFPNIKDGISNNLSFKIALQRSSVFDPIFPRSGSNIMTSVQFTLPYSAFNPNLVNSRNPYKTPEYHKWRFNAEWFMPIGRAMGADKDKQFVLKIAAKYGFMGRYTKKLDFSPFERFQVGDAGLTNNFGLLGYDIVAHRGYPVYENSDPTINPDQQNATRFFTIFNKYVTELRYPLVTNPGSTIYGLAFFEAANGWYDYKSYNPFRLRRSVGVGMRFFLPMFGLLGFDYGIGLDRLQPGNGLKNATRFTFMLGFEPE